MSRRALSALLCVAIAATPAWADTGSAPGSADVLINGKPAQRAGDQTTGGGGTEGSSNVMINGKPAVIGGSCPPDSVPVTSPNVFINGKPAVIGCSK